MVQLFCFLLGLLAVCTHVCQGLYFHIGETEKKCFIEEIPDETMVIGNYRTQLWDKQSESFLPSTPGLGMHVEVKDPDGKIILSRQYGSEGRFTFTSHTPGEHQICLHSNSSKMALFAGGNWHHLESVLLPTTPFLDEFDEFEVEALTVLCGKWEDPHKGTEKTSSDGQYTLFEEEKEEESTEYPPLPAAQQTEQFQHTFRNGVKAIEGKDKGENCSETCRTTSTATLQTRFKLQFDGLKVGMRVPFVNVILDIAGVKMRVHLDIQVGEHTNNYPEIAAKDKLTELQLRARQLLDQVEQIQKEQNYQRYREERFRMTSESTNQRVLWWSITQTIILILTGIWQMRHLKSFFEAKKLV
ncbi:transmembrane emp24 domain-containing protein 4 [Protopterus annectens]|uniref:transmembrane emp24 domain-containing protein 4 n=1 Tax=Protopterus annectens TaxID=7888 RepID=UPI001CFC1FDF|nr:transmembrane emp24 domain-containing protein 4 [Protopterus annectens]